MNTIKEIQDVVEAISVALDDIMIRLRIFGDGSGNISDYERDAFFAFNVDGLLDHDIRDLACEWFFEGYE